MARKRDARGSAARRGSSERHGAHIPCGRARISSTDRGSAAVAKSLLADAADAGASGWAWLVACPAVLRVLRQIDAGEVAAGVARRARAAARALRADGAGRAHGAARAAV